MHERVHHNYLEAWGIEDKSGWPAPRARLVNPRPRRDTIVDLTVIGRYLRASSGGCGHREPKHRRATGLYTYNDVPFTSTTPGRAHS